MIGEPDEAYRYLLRYRGGRLELHRNGTGLHGPIYCDFLAGRLGYRLAREHDKHQPLARAVGLNKHSSPNIVDATAGLGRDASVLAALGCRVLMLERSPIIAALLEDGLRRAQNDEIFGPIIKERLHLKNVDAIEHLDPLSTVQRPDILYLDPMYPLKKKDAKAKKEMRVLRDIVGDDRDAGTVICKALRCAKRRVVVKRPRHASPLPGPNPFTVILGKSTRYDIYPVTSYRNNAHDINGS